MNKTHYNWKEVQEFYDKVGSGRATFRHFGMASQTWNNARRKGWVIVRDHRKPIEELLQRTTNTGRANIKIRLIREGYLVKKCCVCGLQKLAGETSFFSLGSH